MRSRRVLYIQPLAPPKPALGQACNGCGVCCLAEPCPLGVLLTWRWRGPCARLRWQAEVGRYTCGALPQAPQGWWQRLRARWVRRWIAAGQGCDCSLQVDAVRHSSHDGMHPTGG